MMKAKPLHPRLKSHAARALKKTSRAFLCLTVSAPLFAGSDSLTKSGRDLGDLSIEELMNETVTSVSKREQRVGDAAAAISLLTNDDIRRSGATNIPDALRLVPGMDVATVNSRESAVSARGFNNVFSNKLLVLIDGRVVYTPLFAGVLWDLQQTMLEDVDRIEAIRGPGATVWGANAVNGVINVVTRSAKDTQGGLLYGGAGDVHTAVAGMRYGGQVGKNTYYRVFGTYQSNDDFPSANGVRTTDGWHTQNAGFRVDHYPDTATHFTWQADTTSLRFDAGASKGNNTNTIGRWSKDLSNESSVEVQAYYDHLTRSEASRVATVFNTSDITAQHTFKLGKSNNVIWGAGYRSIATRATQTTPFISVRNPKVDLNLYNAFVQDELQVIPDKLIVTAGVKVEHNDFTGYEFQPSIRAVFKPNAQQMFWGAISRAVRTPDEVEGKDVLGVVVGAPFPGPGGLYIPTAVGNGHPRSERLWAYEVGYRAQPHKRVGIDLAAFYNDYKDLINFSSVITGLVPGVPVGVAEIPALNVFNAKTYGGEGSVTMSPSDVCRITAGYSYIVQNLTGSAVASRQAYEDPPTHQATLRVSYDITKQAGVDGQLRYVGSWAGIPSYLTADLRLSWRPNDHLELSVVGQNLLDSQHPETGISEQVRVTEAPRGVYAKITLRF